MGPIDRSVSIVSMRFVGAKLARWLLVWPSMGCISLLAGRVLTGCGATDLGPGLGAGPCGFGFEVCEGQSGTSNCVDIQTDSVNCGGCGIECKAQEVCKEGACASNCVEGQSLCIPDGGAGYCAMLSSDNANCGACGQTCAAEQVCSGGNCVSECAPGQSLCAPNGSTAYCANLQTDNSNCGSCDNVCGPELVCNMGRCLSTCPETQIECAVDGGAPYCATVQSDNANCGACGHKCGLKEVCIGGTCVSSASCSNLQLVCVQDAGTPLCIDPLTDNSNCGACGHACGPVHFCSGGTCQSGCISNQSLCTPDGGAPYCANTQTDNANCGSCEWACGSQQRCLGGTCVDIDAGVDSGPTGFTIGGTLTGLAYNDTVTLLDNGSNDLVLSSNGSFTFAKPVAPGSPYNITVPSPTSPIVQTCVVNNGVGTVATAPVTNVAVNCTTSTYTLTVTLTGLDPKNSLSTWSSGGSITFPVGSGGGTLTFPSRVASGSTYWGVDNQVASGPDYQYCYIPQITVTNANATVYGSCGPVTYTVGGTITGLAPGDTFLLENEYDRYSVTANGAFTFPGRWTSGSPYDVIVVTDPAYPVVQTCTLTSGGQGTVTNANITNVTIKCM